MILFGEPAWMSSPTSRRLELLRETGYVADPVEGWVPTTRHRGGYEQAARQKGPTAARSAAGPQRNLPAVEGVILPGRFCLAGTGEVLGEDS